MKASVLLLLLFATQVSFGQKWPMQNDANFDPAVSNPAFDEGEEPKILFDAGHHNFLVTEGFIKPFEALSKADGYNPVIDSAQFTPAYLDQFDIIMIMTALPFEFTTKLEVTDEIAFTADEINSLYAWVNNGGSLLVFTEHAPFDQAINPLLKKFRLESTVGYVVDSMNYDNRGHSGWIVYSEENGLLNTNHPIVKGRNSSTRVSNLTTYGGSALKGEGYENVLQLSPSAQITKHTTGVGPRGSGTSQCLVGTVGNGKVVALGDSNGFSSMLFKIKDSEISAGLNDSGYDWKQMARNVLYWLSQ
ncbi:hypothetical protein [Fulvivirga lutimaris]|uniref:hypothetical protein n=1 Tax=Fulvivirga lutimaris TaxID=1819566 RepID=UPI0012BC7EE9|nr:hypothetical protein [Fulvivirga lutimaris]MTI38039.1 hypothetical protein [Fulvivirga lutimaris]